MPAPSPPNDDSRTARELLTQFLSASHSDGNADFEALCAAHPDLADELRRLHAASMKLQEKFAFFGTRSGNEESNYSEGARAGETIGDFKLISRIASGGQGEVWEAQQLSLKRRVALKLVLPDRINEKTLALFAREARAGGRLAHPGIVAIHGYGEDDGRNWIAQELVEGSWTLRDFIDEMRNADELPPNYYRSVAGFLAALADALQAAHESGIIHRDVKPQNVLVTKDDQPKLSDFGLARIADETAVSITGDFAGTWLYMSPEQVTAKRIGVDHRTDIFSLGVVMYEMLALVRPFDGDTTHQIAEKIVIADPPDLMKIRSKVPKDLAVICGKALEKAKDARYATMAEFASDLRRWLGNEPILARPPTQVDRAMKWCKRNPTKATAGVLVSVALAIISALLAANVRANQDLRTERENLANANENLEEQTALAEGRAEDLEAERINLSEANEALKVKTAEAEAGELAAKQRADMEFRISAREKLDQLLREVDELWPANRILTPKYERWIKDAQALVAKLPKFEEALARRRNITSGLIIKTPSENEQLAEQFEQILLERFSNEEERILDLIEDIHNLSEVLLEPNVTTERYGWSVAKRLTSLDHVWRSSIEDAEAQARWLSAKELIEGLTVYSGLEILPQEGLLPIGPDPASGLWEFAHLQSGDVAKRGENGKLVLTDDTGLVFVLIPGGAFLMGAQSEDPSGHNYDLDADVDESKVHEVVLSPFFLSKFEMTQKQWERVEGSDPSYWTIDLNGSAVDGLRPVEQVSWLDSRRVMRRLGLALPSEAQWEYACRAGSRTVRPFEMSEFVSHANIRDASYDMEFSGGRGGEPWNDGYGRPAPVGLLGPNDWGLHDVIGNVWEWCEDGYLSNSYADTRKLDPIISWDVSAIRVARGGGFQDTSGDARSAIRFSNTQNGRVNEIGLRPVLTINPAKGIGIQEMQKMFDLLGGDKLYENTEVSTLTNLHYDPSRFTLGSSNYQQSAFIPAFSKIRVDRIDPGAMTFTVIETGTRFTYEMDKHLVEPFELHLLKSFGAPQYSTQIEYLSEIDRAGIEAGKATVGMTKDGVLLALGHPPDHANSSLRISGWTYWNNRWAKFVINFDERGFVTSIDF